jgi:hypothetical protein
MADDELLTRKQAAAYLQKKGCKMSHTTLAGLAINNNADGGPPYTVYRRFRRNYVSYKRADLDAWAEKKLRRVE